MEWKDDLVSPLDVVSVRDPAIDIERTDVAKYVATRNPRLVVAAPGQHLVVAKIKPLRYEVIQSVRSLADFRAQLAQAFRLGVTAIENFEAPGAALLPTGSLTLDGLKHIVWTFDELNRIATVYGRFYIDEIAMVIIARGEEGKAWGGAAPYTVPPSLDAALMKMLRQRAELLLPRDGTRSSDESASASP